MTKEREKQLNQLIRDNKFQLKVYQELPLEETYYLYQQALKLQEDETDEQEKKKSETKAELFYSLTIEKVKGLESFFILFFAPTNMPYVVCDEETFDDEVLLYTTEEKMKKASAKYQEAGVKLRAMQVKKEQYLGFFSNMFAFGANALLVNSDDEHIILMIDKICRKPDPSEIKNRAALVSNPELQLTTMYFMQEMHKPADSRDQEKCKELQEELLVDLLKGTLLMPVFKLDEEQLKLSREEQDKLRRIPFLKNKEGDTYLPVFTDIHEFVKYNRENKYDALILEFGGVMKQLHESLKGIAVNPFGNNLMILGDNLRKIMSGKGTK
ncbi:MAG: SseB family protein [Lachnospiraceae bacterium]|nr:SseB family protein [Lachnospiraceae bacterium]MDD3614622.1 SseB family protein [Lachnospiraceae bacterium]